MNDLKIGGEYRSNRLTSNEVNLIIDTFIRDHSFVKVSTYAARDLTTGFTVDFVDAGYILGLGGLHKLTYSDHDVFEQEIKTIKSTSYIDLLSKIEKKLLKMKAKNYWLSMCMVLPYTYKQTWRNKQWIRLKP